MNAGAVMPWLIAAALLVVIALAARAFFDYQHRQLFKPTPSSGPLSPNPGDHDVAFESVVFPGDQGQDLHGWFLPCGPQGKDPKPQNPGASTLLFCHGNRGNLSDRVQSCLLYRSLGLNVFAFDYRGYGRSPGTPSEQGLYSDAEAAWRYLVENRGIAANDIVILGRSLGGAVASHLALHTQPVAVVIEATFTSIPDLARVHYPRLPMWGLGRMRFDNAARISQIKAPLLLVHSEGDAVIAFSHARALHAIAPKGTQLIGISGAHSDGHITSGDAYLQPLSAFLDANHVRRYPEAEPVKANADAQTPVQRNL